MLNRTIYKSDLLLLAWYGDEHFLACSTLDFSARVILIRTASLLYRVHEVS